MSPTGALVFTVAMWLLVTAAVAFVAVGRAVMLAQAAGYPEVRVHEVGLARAVHAAVATSLVYWATVVVLLAMVSVSGDLPGFGWWGLWGLLQTRRPWRALMPPWVPDAARTLH